MVLTYLVFGAALQNYSQAYFSILSFLARKSGDDLIVVLTDRPEFFEGLREEIEVLTLDNKQLEDWKGPYQFFWRIKIKALQEVVLRYPSRHVLYLDSDTFFFRDATGLKDILEAGSHLMHLNEGALSELPSKTEGTMWRQLKGKTFEGVAMETDLHMWNAGVVGVSKHDTHALERALALCDALCEQQVTPRLIEQFALSVALSRGGMAAADHVIGHYWSNKKGWNERIGQFFAESLLKGWGRKEQLEAVAAMDFSEVPVSVQTRNRHRRWVKRIDRWFPPKSEGYIPGKVEG